MARTKGTGGITRLDKQPKARCRHWRLEVCDSTGKRRYRKFKGTYSQAEQALVQFEEELAAPVSGDTFREYAYRWLASREVAPQTHIKEDRYIRALCLHLGDMPIAAIKRADVQNCINSIRNGGGLSKRKLTGATANSMFHLLKQILQEAVYDEIIDSNPAILVRAPKVDTEEKQALTIAQVEHMLECLEMLPLDGHTVGIRLAVLAGSRRGEILGYQWEDVKDGKLYVQRAVEQRTGDIREPKTGNGVRVIPMLPRLEKDLKEWKKQQAYRLSVVGVEQTEKTPIVTAESGERMVGESLAGWWRRNNKKLFGVDCTLHELRHTFLTLLANSGATAQAIKSIAGWSRIAMADTYVHTDDDANAAAVEALSNRFKR